MLNPRSLIMTSGTLTPLASFQAELQVPFENQLVASHVISTEQVNVQIISRSVNNHPFNFSYPNRDKLWMYEELGLTVA